jgi:murein DD-endopeptidase MepM/ murein hydrolase activator NlpD
MVIPERTRRVHKVVIPFFFLKLGMVLVSLCTVFLFIIGIDYVHVLGRMAENKQLKGENFKLRQEIQVIKNKVDSMESTVERVRNYAKKLQILTGQPGKATAELLLGPSDTTNGEKDFDREPSSGSEDHSSLSPNENEESGHSRFALNERVDRLEKTGFEAESDLSRLQVYLLAKSAIASATPSLVPISGWISSPYGWRRHPIQGTFRLHAGIDIAAEPGTPVRAPASGMVIFSGFREGYGKCVVIDHGYGIRTLFAHLLKIFVNTGIRIKRGDIISQVGSTGMSTGPHLHYEVRKNGVPVNPVSFFSQTRF